MTHPGAEPTDPRSLLVVGASLAGLFAAAAAAQAGYAVTVVERDELVDSDAPRPGVPQGRQPHILLEGGLRAAEALLPGLRDELRAAGAVPFDTGRMPWLGREGWVSPSSWPGTVTSISRPRLELLVRRRVLAVPGVRFASGVRVSGLGRLHDGWEVIDERGVRRRARWVVDASGRSSRLPHWLRQLGLADTEPQVVEAKLGYACRTYRGNLGLDTGVVLAATPMNPAGGSALPIEDDQWLLCAAGYGERRPGRELRDFETFFDSLDDPALADIARHLEPVSDVAVHRQTGNRRFSYGERPDWPSGLLVVGDALCAFNPVYGQGITVAATQAQHLRTALAGRGVGPDRSTRRIQRRLAALTDLPWAVATGEDRRLTGLGGTPRPTARLAAAWTTRLVTLATRGDPACGSAMSRVYHLTGSPKLLVSPPVVLAVARSVRRPLPPPAPRPSVLDAFSK